MGADCKRPGINLYIHANMNFVHLELSWEMFDIWAVISTSMFENIPSGLIFCLIPSQFEIPWCFSIPVLHMIYLG